MLKAQQSMTVISGTQFQQSSYLPSDVMRKLVSRGPTSAARDLLKSFGWNGVDAVATPMVRIDPVQGKLMGEWVFFLFHVLSVYRQLPDSIPFFVWVMGWRGGTLSNGT